MPLNYDIDADRRIITITGDYAEPNEWRVLLTAIAADPRSRGGFGFLRDVRESAHPVSAQSVAGIIAVVRQFWNVLGARRAAVLTRPGIDIPATVAHALAEDEHLPLRTFNSYDDAVAWLNGG